MNNPKINSILEGLKQSIHESGKRFEDLPIKAQRLHPDRMYEPLGGEISEIEGIKIREIYLDKKDKIKPVVKSIPISNLMSYQVSNKISDLKKMYQAAPSIEALKRISKDRPIAAKYNGKILLIDGYTRTILLKALGAKNVEVDFYDLDERE